MKSMKLNITSLTGSDWPCTLTKPIDFFSSIHFAPPLGVLEK